MSEPTSPRRAIPGPSETTTVCGWKGTASYHDVVVDGERNGDDAWTYPDAKEEAEHIEGRISFWNGVEVRSMGPLPVASQSLGASSQRRMVPAASVALRAAARRPFSDIQSSSKTRSM